ncbi:DMA protein, partial [Trogon melanurus]|nr:DMA protein [Trogon melanurus]
PRRALAVTFDADPLFWFDFPGARWTPGLPQGPPWPRDLETPQQLLVDVQLCQNLLENLGRAAAGVLPEAKGVPVVSVFPLRPTAVGEATTLVCLVENIFPPAVDIAWRRGGVPVTAGVTRTPYTPTGDGAFVRFSHLAATPRAGDVYACVVTHEGGNA